MNKARRWLGRLGIESVVAYGLLLVGLVKAFAVMHRA